jgi:neutral ceramidase
MALCSATPGVAVKWPGYIADVRSAALGGYGADGGNLIQVGAGEHIMTKHLENYYQLTGLMRTSLP